MCLSTVYKNTMTPDAVAMRNVMAIECKDGQVILTDLMERQVAIEGTLEMANLVDGIAIVKEIIPEENKVILGDLKSLERTEMRLKDWNIISPEMLLDKEDVIVKIRYRKQANRCTVTLMPDHTLQVSLHEPLTAIASGQAAAFYRDDVVLGGGIII